MFARHNAGGGYMDGIISGLFALFFVGVVFAVIINASTDGRAFKMFSMRTRTKD